MRIYYECFELLPEGAAEEEPDFVRVDITDKTESEKAEILDAIKEQFEGKKHILRLHYCKHDEHKPCEVEVIEESA
ncbi:MAG: hypothetical protein N2V72_00110 [Methanophagales archaeon]|nr:hypothetical protein [Methanophagales archaeon]